MFSFLQINNIYELGIFLTIMFGLLLFLVMWNNYQDQKLLYEEIRLLRKENEYLIQQCNKTKAEWELEKRRKRIINQIKGGKI